MHNVDMDPIDALQEIPVVSRGSLRGEIGTRLLAAIFRGELPAGTRLMVMKLAARVGTSSTPVREALVELESIGVVQFVPNRGAEVAPFGPQELQEIYQVRRILEVEATRCACGRIDRETLEQLAQIMHRLVGMANGEIWSQEASAADRRLHGLIVAGCGSQRLTNEIRRYEGLVQTIREAIGPNRPLVEQALEEHLAIVDALLLDDRSAAGRAMSNHIDSAAAICQAAMFRTY